MSFLDKVKNAATTVAAEAKKGTVQLQTKVEQGQLRKKADEQAKALGYLIARQRSQGVQPGDEEEITRAVSEISDLDTQIKAEQEEAAAKVAGIGTAGTDGAEDGGASAAEPPPPAP